MKKSIMVSLFLVSSPLWAQSAMDVIRQLDGLQGIKLDAVCETCEAAKVAEAAAPRGEAYTPQDALRDINSGKLTFMGRDLFPGSDQNRTCVYKSDKAYILYYNCMSSKKEAPATDIEIISFDGGVIRFYVENGQNPAPISTLPRSAYDSSWTVSLNPGPPPGSIGIAGLKAYKEKVNPSSSGGCSVGKAFGAQNMNTKGFCYGGYKSPEWMPVAESFWKEPGEDWYAVKKYLRKTVLETKF
jgi:hypothetical protein